MVGCGPLRVLQRSEAIKAAFSQTVGRHMEERNGQTKAEKYAELSGVVALKSYDSQDQGGGIGPGKEGIGSKAILEIAS